MMKLKYAQQILDGAAGAELEATLTSAAVILGRYGWSVWDIDALLAEGDEGGADGDLMFAHAVLIIDAARTLGHDLTAFHPRIRPTSGVPVAIVMPVAAGVATEG